MKISVKVLSDNSIALRLPALISGLLLLVSIPLAVFLLKGSRTVFLFSTMIVSFNGALIHYSQTARGYSMQCLFISLFVVSLVIIMKNWGYSRCFSYTLFIFPVLSILTLPTSVLYVFPICLLHTIFICKNIYISTSGEESRTDLLMFKRFLRDYPGVAVSYVVLSVFVIFWYVSNYESFRAGQKVGEEISSASELAGFTYATLLSISSPLIWVFALLPLVFKKQRLIAISSLTIILFPFFLAPLTLAGPPRVYIPALCLLPTISAMGIEGLLGRIKLKPVFLYAIGSAISIYILTVGLRELKVWTPTDWGVFANNLIQTVDKNVYIAYPATAGLPIYANLAGKAVIDNLERLPRGDEHLLLVVGDAISGTDIGTNTEQIEMPASASCYDIDGIPLNLHKLKNILVADEVELANCKLLFSTFGPGAKDKMNYLISAAMNHTEGLWILCNPWLMQPAFNSSMEPLAGEFLACRLADGTDWRPLKNMAEKYQSELSFYVIDH